MATGRAVPVRNNTDMRPRAAAFGLWAALTFSCAVVVHGVVHAVGAQAFVWDSPAHVVMLAVALGMLRAVAAPLGLVGPARERRRRLALVRAQLGPGRLAHRGVRRCSPRPGSPALLLAAEGAVASSLAGSRPRWRAGSPRCSARRCLFRATRDRVVALLAAFAAAADQATAPPPVRRLALRPARATVPYRLFVPNRPPPR